MGGKQQRANGSFSWECRLARGERLSSRAQGINSTKLNCVDLIDIEGGLGVGFDVAAPRN